MEKRNRFGVFVAAVAAVVVASLVPTEAAPSAAAEAHAASDLLWHAATYAALTFVGLYAVERERRLVVAGVVFCVGAGVEGAQAFVPYRTASLLDVAANSVGVVSAVVVAYVFERFM